MFTGSVDAQVEALLAGKDIFADAQRIVPVLVAPKPSADTRVENLEGFTITKKGKLLTAAQMQRLQNVIFNAKTYDFIHSKRCPFTPYVGFIFEKTGKQAHALFCFACNEVSFGRDGKQGNLEDFDAARQEILSLAREIFPEDALLKKLGAK